MYKAISVTCVFLFIAIISLLGKKLEVVFFLFLFYFNCFIFVLIYFIYIRTILCMNLIFNFA